MLRRLALRFLVLALGFWLAQVAAAADTFTLLNGLKIEGDPISCDGRGVVFKRGDLSFTERVPWTNFSQSALKILVKHREAKPFADPLIEDEDEDDSLPPPPPPIKLKPVPRIDRPDPKAGLSALFTAPVSLTIFLLLYLANLYAGYEIARYRNQPPGLVCGMAALVPVIGPIIFLSLPTRIPEEVVEEAPPPTTEPIQMTHAAPLVPDPGAAEAAPASAAPATGAAAPPTIYRRPQTTFNRRFFETKLAGFLRVVPTDAERDLVLCVAATRGKYVGTRITRIMSNELALLVKKGEASNEVMIPFSEISEVQVRHRDTAG